MPNIATPKDKIKNFPDIPRGVYRLKVTGFQPTFSKKQDSVNLNPVLEIVGAAPITVFNATTQQNETIDINGSRAFSNVNTNAFWIEESFVHACGLEMVDKGDSMDLPVDFTGPDDDPTRWTAQGPLIGAVCVAEVLMREGVDTKGVKSGKKSPTVNEFLCQVPGCQAKHAKELAK